MKKITSFLMMFMLFVGMGWAQDRVVFQSHETEPVSDLATITAENYYVIYITESFKSKSNAAAGAQNVGYLKHGDGENGRIKASEISDLDKTIITSRKYLWKLTPNASKSAFKVTSIADGKTIPGFTGAVDANESGFNPSENSDEYVFETTGTSGVYKMKSTKTNGLYLNHVGTDGLWVATNVSRAMTVKVFKANILTQNFASVADIDAAQGKNYFKIRTEYDPTNEKYFRGYLTYNETRSVEKVWINGATSNPTGNPNDNNAAQAVHKDPFQLNESGVWAINKVEGKGYTIFNPDKKQYIAYQGSSYVFSTTPAYFSFENARTNIEGGVNVFKLKENGRTLHAAPQLNPAVINYNDDGSNLVFEAVSTTDVPLNPEAVKQELIAKVESFISTLGLIGGYEKNEVANQLVKAYDTFKTSTQDLVAVKELEAKYNSAFNGKNAIVFGEKTLFTIVHRDRGSVVYSEVSNKGSERYVWLANTTNKDDHPNLGVEGVHKTWALYTSPSGKKYLYNTQNAKFAENPNGEMTEFSEDACEVEMVVSGTQVRFKFLPSGRYMCPAATWGKDSPVRSITNTSDPGINFVCEIQTGEVPQKTLDIVKAEVLLKESESNLDFVDYISKKDYNGLTELMQGATRTSENAALVNSKKITFDNNGLYQFLFTRGNRLMGQWDAEADIVGVARQEKELRHVFSKPEADASLLASTWRVVEKNVEGQFNLQQLNSNFYLGNVDNNQLVTTIEKKWGKQFTLTASVGDGLFAMKEVGKGNDANINSCYASNNKGTSEFCYWHDDKNDAGNVFKLKQVTSIPVVVKAAKWSTLNLPVNVIIPTGVKVYYVTNIMGAAIYVSEITGVIPANTPVLLNAEAATYDFEITSESGQSLAKANKLNGANLKRTEVPIDSYYGLIPGAEAGKAVFAPYKSANIPANKAMLPKSNVPAASQHMTSLYFVFGEPTGIEGVEVENEKSNIYYDLNGRCVLYPAKGIFVNGNGQKVIFK